METKIKCPKCGSEQITADKKGFSGGKAVAGALLTGGIGVLAGTIGSKDVIVTCLSCGNQWQAGEVKATVTLNESESEAIDNEAIILLRAGKTLDAARYIEKNRGWTPMVSFKYAKDLAIKHNITLPNKGCLGIILMPIGISLGWLLYHLL